MFAWQILHAHPRLLGPIQEWSGLKAPNGQSWLVDHAAEMGFNMIWFSPFSKTCREKEAVRHGKKVKGSLYAIRDHFHLDDDFSAAPRKSLQAQAEINRAHLLHLAETAQKKNIRLMADMVFNHVAVDHPLVKKEERALAQFLGKTTNHETIFLKGKPAGIRGRKSDGHITSFFFKFRRTTDYKLAFCGNEYEVWDDVAQINYDSPAAQACFVSGENGQKGYWKQVIDWHLDRGFSGFRCDVAYMVPPSVWSDLVQYTHDQCPGAVFMAETLGDNGAANLMENARIRVQGKDRLAFDLAMLALHAWDYKQEWMIHENERLQEIAVYGGAGFADNHDMPKTLSEAFHEALGHLEKSVRNPIIAEICYRDYAMAALLCHSVYMQLGYEYGRPQVSVFKDPDSKKQFEELKARRGALDHPLNLTSRIRAIHEFRRQLNRAHAVTKINSIEHGGPDSRMIKISCTLEDRDSAEHKGDLVLLVNEKPELGPVKVDDNHLLDERTGLDLQRLLLRDTDIVADACDEISSFAAYYTPATFSHIPRQSRKVSMAHNNRTESMSDIGMNVTAAPALPTPICK